MDGGSRFPDFHRLLHVDFRNNYIIPASFAVATTAALAEQRPEDVFEAFVRESVRDLPQIAKMTDATGRVALALQGATGAQMFRTPETGAGNGNGVQTFFPETETEFPAPLDTQNHDVNFFKLNF